MRPASVSRDCSPGSVAASVENAGRDTFSPVIFRMASSDEPSQVRYSERRRPKSLLISWSCGCSPEIVDAVEIVAVEVADELLLGSPGEAYVPGDAVEDVSAGDVRDENYAAAMVAAEEVSHCCSRLSELWQGVLWKEQELFALRLDCILRVQKIFSIVEIFTLDIRLAPWVIEIALDAIFRDNLPN